MAFQLPTESVSSLNSNDIIDQLQSLIHKECVQEIDQACAELAISADPYNWSVTDVQKWLRWMRQQMPELIHFPVEHIQMSGMTLCSLPEGEFQMYFPGKMGEKLFAKFELWRTAMNFFRPDTVFDSLLPESDYQQSSVSYCSSTYPPQTNVYSSPASYNYGNNYSQTQSFPSYTSNASSYTSTPYHTSDYGSETFTSDDEMSDDGHATSYSRSNYSRTSSMYSSCTMSPQHPQTTVQPNMYSHVQQFSNQQQHHQQVQHQRFSHPQASPPQYYCHTPRSSSVSPSPMHSPCASSSRSYSPLQESYPQFENQTQISNINGHRIASPSVSSMSHMKNQTSLYMSPPATPSSPISTPTPVTTTTNTVNTPPTTTSSHIHLWQFLKELLASPHQFGASIRWLDRSKGVFKIEDSVRVAKLWGARKNRPAMNYDKLSRSIRQYYKKGIMKKTERSQRLVYQFCPSYAA